LETVVCGLRGKSVANQEDVIDRLRQPSPAPRWLLDNSPVDPVRYNDVVARVEPIFDRELFGWEKPASSRPTFGMSFQWLSKVMLSTPGAVSVPSDGSAVEQSAAKLLQAFRRQQNMTPRALDRSQKIDQIWYQRILTADRALIGGKLPNDHRSKPALAQKLQMPIRASELVGDIELRIFVNVRRQLKKRAADVRRQKKTGMTEDWTNDRLDRQAARFAFAYLSMNGPTIYVASVDDLVLLLNKPSESALQADADEIRGRATKRLRKKSTS
jgi:hypothetical protein